MAQVYTALSDEQFLSICRGEQIEDPAYSMYYERTRNMQRAKDGSYTEGQEVTGAIFTNIEVQASLIFNDPEVAYLPIKVSNSKFSHILILSGTFESLLIGHFEGAINVGVFEIRGGVFRNSPALNYLQTNGLANSRILISGGTFETKVVLSSARQITLHVTGGSFPNGLYLSGSFEDIIVSGGKFAGDLELSSVLCYNNFQLLGSRAERFVHRNTLTKGGFTIINNLEFEGSGLTIMESLLVNGFFIVGGSGPKFIRMEGRDSSKRLWFVNNFLLLNYSYNLSLSATGLERLIINTMAFENCLVSKDSIWRMDGIQLNSLAFTNHVCLGYQIMQNIVVRENHHLFDPEVRVDTLYDFNILIGLVEQDETIKPSLFIVSSDLGKSLFFNCDFKRFKLTLTSSKITEIFLAGTEMPDKIALGPDMSVYEQQLGYAQLKRAYELRGDTLKAHNYYVREISSYYEYLKLKKESRSDRLTLLVNQWSSNHGQSWARAAIWILIFGFLSFIALCISLGYRLSFTNGDVSLFLNLLGYFTSFLNPLHRNDFMKNLNPSEWSSLAESIDSISKIVLAYLLYQFVQAFRKHGRSSK